jgi:DNA-binding winged helix-turn-helix (wHTH) protein/Flp pilus assembly protein TadD
MPINSLNRAPNTVVLFGVFEADFRAEELRKNGVKIRIQDLPFRALKLLLSRPNEVITREEFRQALWPGDVFVDFDLGIRSAIKRLRDALGDSAENPIFVETVDRRGYRWIAPTHSETPPEVEVSPEPEGESVATAAPALASASLWSWNWNRKWKITGLVAAAALAVAVFVGVYFYRQTARFAARAAGRQEARTVEPRHAPIPEAQDFYLKGRYYWSRRDPQDLNTAVDYFTRAIVKDPAYAPAFVGLADCYNLLREFGAMPGEEAFPRALAAAQRAVELDDSSAEAHNSLAFATAYWSWDTPTAEREFRRALELNPNLVQGHHWYATFLLISDRFPEALDQIEQARKLDPSSTTIQADRAWILRDAGHESEAVALLKQLESADPALATTHAYLAKLSLDGKDYESFFAESKQAAQLRHDDGALAVANAAEQGFAAGGVRGMRERMIPVQKEMFERGAGPAFDMATNYALLGKKEDALFYLKAAYDKREIGLLYLSRNPDFISLHEEPVYKEITKRVGERLRY